MSRHLPGHKNSAKWRSNGLNGGKGESNASRPKGCHGYSIEIGMLAAVQFGIATISGHQKVPVRMRQIAILEVGMESGKLAGTDL